MDYSLFLGVCKTVAVDLLNVLNHCPTRMGENAHNSKEGGGRRVWGRFLKRTIAGGGGLRRAAGANTLGEVLLGG